MRPPSDADSPGQARAFVGLDGDAVLLQRSAELLFTSGSLTSLIAPCLPRVPEVADLGSDLDGDGAFRQPSAEGVLCPAVVRGGRRDRLRFTKSVSMPEPGTFDQPGQHRWPVFGDQPLAKHWVLAPGRDHHVER